MFKYVIGFSKTGIICYTSHLDIMRLFKRSFKKARISLSYSQGFNPHPKMGFAQPLALGYEGLNELMEFETETDYEPQDIYERLLPMMPDGLGLQYCRRLEGVKKTLAAVTDAALYTVLMPASKIDICDSSDISEIDASRMCSLYMGQDKIITLKKQKKKKEPVEVDIKPMIREIGFDEKGEYFEIRMLLDSGSTSNLSPELVIKTILEYFKLNIDRSEIEVTREAIYFEGYEV